MFQEAVNANTTVSFTEITARQEDSGRKMTCRAHTPGLLEVKADTLILDIHCKYSPARHMYTVSNPLLDIHTRVPCK